MSNQKFYREFFKNPFKQMYSAFYIFFIHIKQIRKNKLSEKQLSVSRQAVSSCSIYGMKTVIKCLYNKKLSDWQLQTFKKCLDCEISQSLMFDCIIGNGFSVQQAEQFRLARRSNGLSDDVIKMFANPRIDFTNMFKIRAYAQHFIYYNDDYESLIKIMANENLTGEQIDRVYTMRKSHWTLDTIKLKVTLMILEN